MEELLAEIEKMFSSRQSVITLKKQFEERRWNGNESFRDYLHDKMILGYRIPLPEQEILEYAIDGILDIALRNQARMINFRDQESLLTAFESRDALKKCGLGLSRKDRRSEEEVVINQIMNIEINDSTDNQTTELNINSEIAVEK
ncbi:hypothetical protein M0804_014946 [Polistes exclamans]|nr:hypothetical protein M0804_014946 [Polistes exclamans]